MSWQSCQSIMYAIHASWLSECSKVFRYSLWQPCHSRNKLLKWLTSMMQGNTTGDVYVYDTSDGKRMTHVAPIKVSAPVRACGLSPDCRHLLAVIGNGFIFRFEYRKPDAEVTHQASMQWSAMHLFVQTEQLHLSGCVNNMPARL